MSVRKRVSAKSPVRKNRSQGSVGGLPSNRRFYYAKNLKAFVLLVIVLMFQTSCSTYIPYTPRAFENIPQAKSDIEYVLYTQLKNKTPINMVITDEYIGLGRIDYTIHGMGKGLVQTTSHDRATRIYFRDFLKCDLYQRRYYFPVFVYDKDHYLIYQGFFPT